MKTCPYCHKDFNSISDLKNHVISSCDEVRNNTFDLRELTQYLVEYNNIVSK